MSLARLNKRFCHFGAEIDFLAADLAVSNASLICKLETIPIDGTT
jgi:hypothetical protein